MQHCAPGWEYAGHLNITMEMNNSVNVTLRIKMMALKSYRVTDSSDIRKQNQTLMGEGIFTGLKLIFVMVTIGIGKFH